MSNRPSPTDRGPSVLVAVVKEAADLERARDDGWYRIPVAKAPRPLTSDYLALYLTAACGQERWGVYYLAEVWRYDLRRRRELIADCSHPRAESLYYCLRLGPLQRLERPVPARSLRRLAFIHTTVERLLAAGDVRELWLSRACAPASTSEEELLLAGLA